MVQLLQMSGVCDGSGIADGACDCDAACKDVETRGGDALEDE